MNNEREHTKVKVSVIIPTYKRSEILKRAVNSVLSQTLSDIQLIVVDDNDPFDENRYLTEQVMAAFIDNPKVFYLKHEKNKNGAAARNTGIRKATGEYITFLDDDDEFEPKRLEIMSKYMDTLSSGWGACYSGYKKYMKYGSIQHCAESAEGDLLTRALMRSLYIGSGSNLFFRNSVVKDIGVFDESFVRNQDLEYLVRVLKKYKMSYVNEDLLTIHFDKRAVRLSFEKCMEIELMFESNFKSYIEQLSDNDKKRVIIMHALDRIRMCIRYKKYLKALKNIFKSKVPPNIILKYIIYARDRKKNNTCYGFVF